MRSKSIRRMTALGTSTIVLLAGLVAAPSAAFATSDGGELPATSGDLQVSEQLSQTESNEQAATEPAEELLIEGPAMEGSDSLRPPVDLLAGPTEQGVEQDVEHGVASDNEPNSDRSTLGRTLAASSGFNPGALISDYNFFDSWAMTEAEIQSFLDRNIAAPCENANCLTVLKVNTPNASWSWGTCAPYAGAAQESAARIIFKVQQACGLSAKVILVTLQKEQSLVTRTGPPTEVLRKAMGMGCPDTDVCDAQYYGFFNQVYAAARQLTWYTNPESSMYKSKKYEVGQWKPVQLHPNVGCGAPGVLISNIATAALYWYTPYQPNAAALAAGFGSSSDPCSSYGNRNFFLYYSKWFGDPRDSPNAKVQRIAGADRYDTAVAISRSGFSGTAPVVYIASGENYADALAAGPAASVQGGPLLLSGGQFITQSTIDEIKRLRPGKIVIVGGEPSVSAGVAQTLAQLASVTRLGGNDRFETSRLVADYAFKTATSAYVATGLNFPDALAAGGAAGVKRVPVLLVNGGAEELDPETSQYLRSHAIRSVMIAGGFPSVAEGVSSSLTGQGVAVTRFAGTDRFDTSWLIAKNAFPSITPTAYLATGANFPDALAGAAAAATAKSPLFVTQTWCVHPQVRTQLNDPAVKSVKLLGGTPSLLESVAYLQSC